MSEVMNCDICGESCLHFFSKEFPEDSSPEFATLSANWGYFSSKDMYTDKCIMCEKCYDKVTAFILLLGGKMQRHTYDPWDGKVVEHEEYPFHNDFFNPSFTCKAEPKEEIYNEEDL